MAVPRRVPRRRVQVVKRLDPFPIQLVSEFRRFLQTNDQRTKIPQACPELYQHPVLYPLQRSRELTSMLEFLAAVNPQTLLEIGTDKGSGFYHFCQCLRLTKAIGMDERGCPFGELFTKAFPEQQFMWLARSSRSPGTVETVRNFLAGDPLDVLFLDGNEDQFRADLDTYWPLLRRPGGIVLIHDIRNPGPQAAFEGYRKQARCYSVLVNTTESHEAMDAKIAGQPARTAYDGWLRHWEGQGCGVGILVL